MAENFKNLGQILPAAFTLASVYTVPASRSAVISSILMCNRSETETARVRVAHAIGGAVDAPEQYLYYDEQIPPRKTFAATLGVTAAATDQIRVQSDNGAVAFNAYGSEIT